VRTVVVTINRDRSMLINTESTTEEKLGVRLEEIFKTRAERVVFIKGDPELEFQWVARAIDIAKGAGIDKIGLMTPKMEQGQ
jgi:biopolymer transport protein ExbD